MKQTFTTTIGIYKYTLDVEKVWELTKDKKTQAINLSDLEHCLDWWVWDKGESFTPRKLLEHYQRVADADMSYPIIVTKNPWGKVSHIIDGMHRLIKAKYKGYEKMAVIVLPETFIESHYIEKVPVYCEACGCAPCDCHWGDY